MNTRGNVIGSVMVALAGVFFIVCALFTSGCGGSSETVSAKQPVDYVDPFIGTGGHGHTFPGATAPFGMVQASPDTRILGWDAVSGYHYTDNFIYGFSHTHLSGVGIPDYCDILVMPQAGEGTIATPIPEEDINGYGAHFSHDQETASPGFYSVHLKEPNIDVQLTTTERVALHQYTFNDTSSEQSVVIDLAHRDKVIDSFVEVRGDRDLVGYRHSSAWAPTQKLFFAIRFERPIKSLSIFEDGTGVEGKSTQGKALRALLNFDQAADTIQMKVALSPVSIEGAIKNLDTEMPSWDFDSIHANTRDTWNNLLEKIEIETEDEAKKTIFYSALYHTYVSPNLFSDVDGSYRGRDDQIHKADHPYYTVFSLWDTFRSLHPLMTILEPEATEDWVKTFLLMHEQGGLLPVWDLAGNETFCMNGYHSVSVIADAYLKGIQGFDTELALEAMQNSANQSHFGLNGYNSVGYVGRDHGREGVSRTLEYTYDDWCIAVFADAIGNADVSSTFFKRALNYKNLYSPEDGFFRARENGGWYEPFDENEINFNYTEGNAWHYRFAVPHDVRGLVELYGGDENFKNALDALFNAPSDLAGRHQPDVSGLIGQYAHGNEPSHHVAYLYNYIGVPSETQRRIRETLLTMYSTDPDGLSGNEDCGQMSAWYILSSIGIYQVAPGSLQYSIGSPLFDKASIDLGNGKAFTVIAKNQADENAYIQSISLNGKPLERSYLTHEEIMSGSTLELTMGAEPNLDWATDVANRPMTSNEAAALVPAPLITSPRAFKDSTEIVMTSLEPGTEIWYTLDGSEPKVGESNLYTGPFTLEDTTYMAAIASKNGVGSTTALAETHRFDARLHVEVNTPIHPQYTAGGPAGLVDGIIGTADFTTGRWQGYEDTDLEVVVDLGEIGDIESAEVGFLEDPDSYIRYPNDVEFAVSVDGENYEVVQTVSIPTSGPDVRESSTRRIQMTTPSEGRYLRVRATSPGDVQAWSSTEMIKSFLFCDEIQVDWQ
ncbi:GH92 family glycosyl hydrolase [Pelagicoccus albus]|uniref:Glycoside hydrolase family 92 protein n=1 Tax=Pelagicoccus albus TaxID=415222 RepID=A0A7X1BAN4_9BACT|nr:GH92 family glycosyl hydrolase [Pelagicoccus albus]MBC2607513.1 glycoside hydrolase family 92 protein [Pelagicoccus albus]